MPDLDTRSPADAPRGLERPSVVKGAAWSVPVIVASATIATMVASIADASVEWAVPQTELHTVGLVGSASTVTAGAAVTVPTQLTLANGAEPITGETASVCIVVQQSSGREVAPGRVRGLGVRTFNGSTEGTRTVDYMNDAGHPTTTFASSVAVTLASLGSLDIPVEFGIAGARSSEIDLSALTTFTVTATVTIGGRTLPPAVSTISVPAGGRLL